MAFKRLTYLKASKIMSHAQDMLAVINDFHGLEVFTVEPMKGILGINPEN